MSSSTDILGRWGEAIAADYLVRNGYRIAAQRVRTWRGELDIVAVAPNAPELVFVEVKTRTSHDFGGGVAALTPRKRHALCRAAIHFLRRMKPPQPPFRFDLIEVIGSPELPTTPEINHFKRCFPMERRIVIPWLK